ncbi:MAG: ribonuclease III [Clostridia bacterium]|nr:ribonuclease III [Clostridia bacterium]
MAHGKDIAGLQRLIGYQFKDPMLLQTALTHSSLTNENKARKLNTPSNERLEFLGDAVLQIYISEFLYSTHPDCKEGELTRFRQHLVCEATLARVARSISLGDYLCLGNGEESGRMRPAVLADAFEALLAAIYLDDAAESTGFPRKFLLSLMEQEIRNCTLSRGGDYKTRLQELVQKDGVEELAYEVIGESGPDHDKTFEVIAKINSNVVGRGKGRSKREAEQNAAKEALRLFGVEE